MTREEFLKTFPRLIKGYRPAADAAGRVKNVTLVMIIGPSGVGKSSIIDKSGITFVPSDTSRDPRPGEIEGQDFYFLSDYDQIIDDIKNGRFLQVAVGPAGDFYASRLSSYPQKGLAIMPIVADVVPAFRKLGFKKTISVFVVPPSSEEWHRRMQTHLLTEDQIAGRLAEAKRSLEFALHDKRIHFILNDDIDGAVDQLQSLIESKIHQTKEAAAKKTAQELLDGIN